MRRVAWVALLAVLAAGVPRPGHADELIDRVLAVVSGEVITLSDVRAARTFGLVDLPHGVTATAAVLQQLINRDLILDEVEHYAPPEPAPGAIETRLEAIRRRFPTAEAYRRALTVAGVDEAHLRAVIRDNLRIKAYLDQRFPLPPPPSDEAIAAYYRTHQAAFTREGVLQPLARVRDTIAARLTAERQASLIAEWLGGLRQRADVTILYLPGTAPGTQGASGVSAPARRTPARPADR